MTKEHLVYRFVSNLILIKFLNNYVKSGVDKIEKCSSIIKMLVSFVEDIHQQKKGLDLEISQEKPFFESTLKSCP